MGFNMIKYYVFLFLGAPLATPSDGDKPKAAKIARNWDAVAKEADEIEEGDPLNRLFQKIYDEADENTRRAMMKSFVSYRLVIRCVDSS